MEVKFFTIKRTFKLLILLFIVFFSFKVLAFFSEDDTVLDYKNATKAVSLDDNGYIYQIETNDEKISDLLEDKKIVLGEYDRIIPDKEAKIYPGIKIEIQRAAKVKILVDGKTIEKYIIGKTVKDALRESQVELTRLDKTDPETESLAYDGVKIVVTRINVEEVVKKEEIDFKVIAKNDNEMGWREKEIEILGKKGEKEVKYKITYKDGKEISRIILESNILTEPVSQVEIQGTYMKLGKADKGQGTWYAFKGGMFAASTTLPRGSFAKVTNTANGKSIVVEINDYGPQGKGRIIDLDKVAFQKIASLGAGVIGVKVEPVLN